MPEGNARDDGELAARTPAAPLTPQNQGRGPGLIAPASRMPGKAKPITGRRGARQDTEPGAKGRSAPSTVSTAQPGRLGQRQETRSPGL